MADPGLTKESSPEGGAPQPPARAKDEVALELMKFIAVTTGYGKAPQSGTGFSGKPAGHSAEEYAEALLGLFNRCRRVVAEDK